MRENNRKKILEAAIRVVQRDGARRLTLEATAEEAGLTRGGMMYHFRDREALALAVQVHLAGQWEMRLMAAAGKAFDEASVEERMVAYNRVTMESATRAELELILETGRDPVLHQPWLDVQQRWTPTIEEATSSPDAMRLFIARLAADGLWSYDSLGSQKLSSANRKALSEQIIHFANAAADPEKLSSEALE